jgi:hypothetical protein
MIAPDLHLCTDANGEDVDLLQKKLITIITIALSLYRDSDASAYPVILKLKDKEFASLVGVRRDHTIAFSKMGGGGWQRMPLQFDELEDDGFLVIRNASQKFPAREKVAHPAGVDPFEGTLDTVHRVVLDDDSFAPCDSKCHQEARAYAQKICASVPMRILRIDLHLRKTAGFLAVCASQTSNLTSSVSSFNYDHAARRFSGSEFEVTHSAQNPMILENLVAGKSKTNVFTRSLLEARFRPKFFLPISLREGDLLAEVTSIAKGPISHAIELSMTAKTLGFKTGAQICCDVSYYKDAFYFPVIIELPFKGKSLQKGSGIYYGLTYAGNLEKDLASQLTKVTQAQKSNANSLTFNGELSTVAIGFRGGRPGRDYSVSLANPSELQGYGFQSTGTNTGIFVDVGQSEATGTQRFEIWFYIGSKDNSALLTEYASKGIQYSARPVE